MKKSSTLTMLTALLSIWLFTTQSAIAQPLCQAGFQFTTGSTSPNGTIVNLYDSSYSAGTITNWQWSFGNGTGSTLQNPVTALPPGMHYVCLTITAIFQNQSCTSTYCDTLVIPGGTSCDASFYHYSNILGNQFNSNGTNNTSWFWDFGDGNTSTQQNPFHTYSANGNYTACLTVTDASGISCTSCQSVTIGSTTACQAYFNATQMPGTNTFDFTDLSQGNAQYFNWTFGDGGSSNLQNPSHTYNGPGIYSVCLTIIDSIQGCYDVYCDLISVGSGTQCNAAFGFQTSPAMGTSFNAASNTNNTSWTWDFGDGSTGTGQFVTHVYAPGNYAACLTVTNSNGQTCTSCQSVIIQSNSNCSSNFAIHPDTLTAHSYYAYNLATGVGPISYVWSWGDGTSSTGAYPSHTYASAGLYTICLTIVDAVGCTSNTCYQFSLLRLSGSGVPVTINVVGGTTGISENNLINSLVVSPNPANDYVEANFSLTNDTEVAYSIKSITGQTVAKSTSMKYATGSHTIRLDLSEYPAGMYLLEVIGGGSKKFTKILVQ